MTQWSPPLERLSVMPVGLVPVLVRAVLAGGVERVGMGARASSRHWWHLGGGLRRGGVAARRRRPGAVVDDGAHPVVGVGDRGVGRIAQQDDELVVLVVRRVGGRL